MSGLSSDRLRLLRDFDAAAKDIRTIFGRIAPDLSLAPTDVAGLAYTVTLLQRHARELTHGEAQKRVRQLVAALRLELPSATRLAEDVAAAAQRAGHASIPDAARVVHRDHNLLAALHAYMAEDTDRAPDKRSWWHWYAGALAQSVAVELSRVGLPRSTGKPTTPFVRLVTELVRLGYPDITEGAVQPVLQRRDW